MACRKDGKGRVLRKGEHYRKTDGRYSYIYTDPLGKQRTVYAVVLQIKWYSNPHFIWNCIGWNFIYPFTLNEAVSSQ